MSITYIPVGSKVWINLRAIRHVGVYLGNNRVIHNSKRTNQVVTEDLETFASGHTIKFCPPKQTFDQNDFYNKAEQIVGQKYSVSRFNCEHLASYLLGGKVSSPQWTSTMTSAGIGFLIGTFSNLSFKQTMVLSCALGFIGLAFANSRQP